MLRINSKILRSLFLLVFLANLFFIHVVFQQFVICHEVDGRVVIEKLNSDECGTKTPDIPAGVSLENNNDRCNICTDYSASEKFGSDRSQSLKHRHVQQPLTALVILPENFFTISNEYNTPDNQKILLTSPPLEAYKTVSLLI